MFRSTPLRALMGATAAAGLVASGLLATSWTADAISSADVAPTLNGHTLTESHRTNIALLAEQYDQMPGEPEQRIHTLAVATWWSIKEGPLALTPEELYSNCHANGSDERHDGEPLFTCVDPAGTQIWQVGTTAPQVAAVTTDSVAESLPGTTVDEALQQSIEFHGLDPESETGRAIRDGDPLLQQGWLARHPVLGAVASAEAAEWECFTAESPANNWCFTSDGGPTWDTERQFAPDLATSEAVVAELEEIYAGLVDGAEPEPTEPEPTEPGGSATGTVADTGGMSLNVRAEPSTSSAVIGAVHTGQDVTIECQVEGEPAVNDITGWQSSLWNRVEGGYVADVWVLTGHDARIPGVPDCAEDPAPEPEPTDPEPEPTEPEPSEPEPSEPEPGLVVPPGELVPLRQGLGHPGQWADCGPTSAVVTLLAMGITPDYWDPANPVAAIEGIQEPGRMAVPDIDHDPDGTGADEVSAGLNSYGLETITVSTPAEILAAVREGRPAIANGMTTVFPWEQQASGPVGHWVAVVGYDTATGEYLVIDPISAPGADQVHRATEAEVYSYMVERGTSVVVAPQ